MISVHQPALCLNPVSGGLGIGNVPFHLHLFIDGRNEIIISAALLHKAPISDPLASARRSSPTCVGEPPAPVLHPGTSHRRHHQRPGDSRSRATSQLLAQEPITGLSPHQTPPPSPSRCTHRCSALLMSRVRPNSAPPRDGVGVLGATSWTPLLAHSPPPTSPHTRNLPQHNDGILWAAVPEQHHRSPPLRALLPDY